MGLHTHSQSLQVGMGGMECYEKDFEEQLLTATRAFYKRKAADWIEQVGVQLFTGMRYCASALEMSPAMGTCVLMLVQLRLKLTWYI